MLIPWGWRWMEQDMKNHTFEGWPLMTIDDHWWTCMNPSYSGLRNQDALLSGLWCIANTSEMFRICIQSFQSLGIGEGSSFDFWSLLIFGAGRRGLWASSWRGCLKATRQCLAGLSATSLELSQNGRTVQVGFIEINERDDLRRSTGDCMGHI